MKQPLNEEFRRMQKLAGLITENKEMLTNLFNAVNGIVNPYNASKIKVELNKERDTIYIEIPEIIAGGSSWFGDSRFLKDFKKKIQNVLKDYKSFTISDGVRNDGYIRFQIYPPSTRQSI